MKKTLYILLYIMQYIIAVQYPRVVLILFYISFIEYILCFISIYYCSHRPFLTFTERGSILVVRI